MKEIKNSNGKPLNITSAWRNRCRVYPPDL